MATKWLKTIQQRADMVGNGLHGFVFKSVSLDSFCVLKSQERCREFLFTCYTRTHSLTHTCADAYHAITKNHVVQCNRFHLRNGKSKAHSHTSFQTT